MRWGGILPSRLMFVPNANVPGAIQRVLKTEPASAQTFSTPGQQTRWRFFQTKMCSKGAF
jgi:hypothetical protein